MREIERRAGEEGLQPIRWPEPWPGNTLHAMRVATYAKSIGRTVSFTLAAFRPGVCGRPRPDRSRQRRDRRGGLRAAPQRDRQGRGERVGQGQAPRCDRWRRRPRRLRRPDAGRRRRGLLGRRPPRAAVAAARALLPGDQRQPVPAADRDERRRSATADRAGKLIRGGGTTSPADPSGAQRHGRRPAADRRVVGEGRTGGPIDEPED